MNWWIKLGCMLTGWSSNVLAQCSEASRSHLSKYTSALLILILIWGVTGFCFAQRYIGLSWWGCVMISLFFSEMISPPSTVVDDYLMAILQFCKRLYHKSAEVASPNIRFNDIGLTL